MTLRTSALLLAFIGIGIASPLALALDQSKLPKGANHERAHVLPHKATGKNIPIGIIEVGEDANGDDDLTRPGPDRWGIRAANNLGTRLKGQYDFWGKNPGDAPVDISGVPINGGSNHSTLVADVAAGDHATFTGVANDASVYYSGIDGDKSFEAAVDWLNRNKGVNLFNNSWGGGANDNGSNQYALFSDWFMQSRDALFVKSAGNVGNSTKQISLPGDFFNGITVGATDASFMARADYSSYWLQGDTGANPDIRGKPDVLAPGTSISDGKSYGGADVDGTSFAAPHVTGVAAMLMEKGLDLPGGEMRNHLGIKSIILNSARKRGINPPENAKPFAKDNPATANEASDADYLAAWTDSQSKDPPPKGEVRMGSTSTAPKTDQWTPSQWSSPDGRKLTVNLPLDDEQGTGVLDAERALIQFDGGEQDKKLWNPGGIDPIGWNLSSLSQDFGMDEYEFNFAIQKGTFITATLVWDREVIEIDNGTRCVGSSLPATCGVVNTWDTYQAGDLPDFDLYIYKGDTLFAESISRVDSLEHLHFPVPEYGNPFEYSLRVDLHGTGDDFINYALAWWTVPEPETLMLIMLGLVGLAATRRGGLGMGVWAA